MMSITLTNIAPAVSLKPSGGVVQYSLKTKEDKPLESMTTTLSFTNSFPGIMNASAAGVSPNYWEKGREATYTMIFSPKHYEINMKVEVWLDKRIGIPADFDKKNNSCLGIRGVDRLLIECIVDRYDHKITLKNLFESRDVQPDEVEIIFQTLSNPMENTLLDSWRLKTYTWDGYAIDELDAGL